MKHLLSMAIGAAAMWGALTYTQIGSVSHKVASASELPACEQYSELLTKMNKVQDKLILKLKGLKK